MSALWSDILHTRWVRLLSLLLGLRSGRGLLWLRNWGEGGVRGRGHVKRGLAAFVRIRTMLATHVVHVRRVQLELQRSRGAMLRGLPALGVRHVYRIRGSVPFLFLNSSLFILTASSGSIFVFKFVQV